MKIRRINEITQYYPTSFTKDVKEIIKSFNECGIYIKSGKNTQSSETKDFEIVKLQDGSIDVIGSVIANEATSPIPIKLNNVWGDFWVPKFEDPINFPNEVGGAMIIYGSQIGSLVGGPKSIGDRLDIRDCPNIKSLLGCPKVVGENFNCTNTNIKSLEHGPSIIGHSGKFFGKDSSHFDYSVGRNQISSLSGCPEIVTGDFDCSWNNLENFEGGPKIVNWSYSFICNNIKDFSGFPEYDSSYIKFIGYRHKKMFASGGVPIEFKTNPVEEILNLIPDDRQLSNSNLENAERSKVILMFIDSLNRNGVIRNGDTIIADRLIHSLEECGIDIDYDELQFKNYNLK